MTSASGINKCRLLTVGRPEKPPFWTLLWCLLKCKDLLKPFATFRFRVQKLERRKLSSISSSLVPFNLLPIWKVLAYGLLRICLMLVSISLTIYWLTLWMVRLLSQPEVFSFGFGLQMTNLCWSFVVLSFLFKIKDNPSPPHKYMNIFLFHII